MAAPTTDSLPVTTMISMVSAIKLNATNYLLWRRQIVNMAECFDLMGFLDGSITTPSPTTTSAAGAVSVNPAFMTWKMKDRKLLSVMYTSLSEDAASKVIDSSTSRDMWLTLEGVYSASRQHQLREELLSLRRGSSSVEEYGTTDRQRNRLSDSHESMYRATVEGDLVAADMLLEKYPSLCIDEISEDGDRALHMAAAMKHQELVEKLLKRMSPADLTLLDGHGYTACCYAAIAGAVEIVDMMMRKNATLATARDRENKTPLYKAAFRRNAGAVSNFLKLVRVEDLPVEEWFDLLCVSIRRGMYDVALEISRKNEQVATMRNNEGTALHMLARMRFYKKHWQWRFGVMRQHMRILAENLWGVIQRLGQARALELIKNPPLLHAAAEEGNVELIIMITHTYPHLVWHTDSKGYTIFHIAVKYRKENLFVLIDEIGARVDSIAVTQDENGNNIFHLAAELGVLDSGVSEFPIFQLQREISWFKKTREIIPPVCSEMRNKDRHTPYELFKKEHEKLMEKNRTWTKNAADSWMLISTLMFSVVFASAFAVPGGFDQSTGIPVLYKSTWFTCFVVFEALAMLSSALSVFYFSRTMMGSEHEVIRNLPNRMKNGLLFLSFSVISAASAFMSAYFLVYTKYRAALVTSVILAVYVTLVLYVFLQNVLFRLGLSGVWFWKWNHRSLFRRHDGAVGDVRVSKLLRALLWIIEG